MKMININELDKYEVTRIVNEVREMIKNNEVHIFDAPVDIFEEILGLPRDKDGCIPKFYLSDGAKGVVESFYSMKHFDE